MRKAEKLVAERKVALATAQDLVEEAERKVCYIQHTHTHTHGEM